MTPENVWVWTVFLFALGLSDAVRKDLDQSLGYWPGLLVTGVISAVLAMLAAIIFKWGWRKGLVLGVVMQRLFTPIECLNCHAMIPPQMMFFVKCGWTYQ